MSAIPKSDLPYRLLAPGPVPVPAAVLRVLGDKVLHHRTPQFIEILHGVWAGLKTFFATTQPVLILTGSGTAGMEAAVANTLSPGDEALVVVSGKFGERWVEICESYNVQAHRLEVEWGAKLNLEEFATTLQAYPNVSVVLTQACETSTATLHPVQEMARLVRQHLPNALIAVDAITAIGCTPLPMDEWDIDVVVAGSQKAFMLPAGLSFIALSERAWKVQAEAWADRYYFNLAEELKFNLKGDSQFSIPTSLVAGLGVVLEQVKRTGGLENLWKRCAILSAATRSFGAQVGMGIYSQSPSPSVTALTTPSDSTKIRDRLEREYNLTIMGGQDQAKGKILRVGHMGDVRNEDMMALFSALSEILGQKPQLAPLERQLQNAGVLFP